MGGPAVEKNITHKRSEAAGEERVKSVSQFELYWKKMWKSLVASGEENFLRQRCRGGVSMTLQLFAAEINLSNTLSAGQPEAEI